VIIHAAPALTGANTLVWGSTADATVLVTQRDKTGREPVVTAADAMRRVGASIVGVVLNEGRELRMLRKSRVRKRDGGPERTGASGGSEVAVAEPVGAGPPHDELLPNGGRQQRVMTANQVDDVLPPAGSPQGPPRQ
jgi:hypothetical protein